MFRFASLSAVALLLLSCSTDTGLRPFTSDGCSLFPDASLLSGADWCSCCFDHDLRYWRGGTRDEREAADRELQRCVEARSGNALLARSMYRGVRVGGSPYFHTWYRWGYGWPFERKYGPLSRTEAAEADRLVADYFATVTAPACGS